MKEKMKQPVFALRCLFAFFTLACLIAAVAAPDRGSMFAGLGRICTQSGQTVKSFFDPSYGGFSGTFLNVGLVCLVCLGIFCLPNAKPDGVSVLAFFLTAGFSFWGTTLLNIWFSFLGVALFALIKHKSLGSLANAFLFSTGIGPLITEMMFNYPTGEWHFTVIGLIIAIAVGLFIGLMLSPGIAHAPNMHKGYNLYNAAVPIGLTAFFLRCLLYKVFQAAPPASVNVGTGDSFPVICYIFVIAVFAIAIVWGLLLDGGKQYGKLLKDPALSVDFCTKYGMGATIMNFGVYGLFIVLYYTIIGANWNAATIGCVFCMVCCCAKGSHPLTVWPIMIGYVIASFIAKAVCTLTGAEFSMAINAQAIVIGLCFANGLSPISGGFGWLAGIAGGMAHYTFVTCIPLLHGGWCLYNGGFTCAFVCFLFVPVLENYFGTKADRKKLKASK